MANGVVRVRANLDFTGQKALGLGVPAQSGQPLVWDQLGTSGAKIPLLNASNTFGGNQTFDTIGGNYSQFTQSYANQHAVEYLQVNQQITTGEGEDYFAYNFNNFIGGYRTLYQLITSSVSSNTGPVGTFNVNNSFSGQFYRPSGTGSVIYNFTAGQAPIGTAFEVERVTSGSVNLKFASDVTVETGMTRTLASGATTIVIPDVYGVVKLICVANNTWYVGYTPPAVASGGGSNPIDQIFSQGGF